MDCKPTRFLCPWNFPGKNTGVGYHSPLQGIFATQGSNLNLLHFRQILYSLSHQGSPQLQVNKLKRKILSLVKNDEDTDSCITCFYLQILTQYISVQLSHSELNVSQSCLTLCDPMDCSTSGFFVLYYLSELVQTHIYWVSDAIQPSHPLLFSSPPVLNLSQNQSLLQWINLPIRWPK